MADLIAIRRGLLGPAHDRKFWRDKAEMRLSFLEEDANTFGLTDAEKVELAALKEMLAELVALRPCPKPCHRLSPRSRTTGLFLLGRCA